MMKKDLIKELSSRGMIQDMTPGLEEVLQKETVSGYIGFDPTASSLHIGNLATLMLLKHLQLAGHKPFVLVGGATGMIGDPSGKSEERKFLDEETIRKNLESQTVQLRKFLDFDSEENAAEVVNNYDWFKEISFLRFLRDAGKHITINYMMAKESVKKRLETGISFTEFTYQLVQAYDFYHLREHRNVKLQMGGGDQWGNITTGTELIRRKGGKDAYALTCPLITKADGSKFGKSESGNVWLDADLTSPYKFYQFWLNCADEDAGKLIRVFTLLPIEEIEKIEAEHHETPHLRLIQKAIAEDVTTRVHGKDAYETAVKASKILFGKNVTEELRSIDERTLLSVFEGVPMRSVSKTDIENAEDVTELLGSVAEDLIFKSKGEAKRMIKSGGISINKEKVSDPAAKPEVELLQGKYLLIQKGKKNYFLLKAEA